MPDQPPKVESKRREGASNPDSKTDYQFPRRLALCLDGTWNERDSGTNIYHFSNLILEGKIEPAPSPQPDGAPNDPATTAQSEHALQGMAGQTWVQMVYYDEGVGTGMLDRVTGGGLGRGLSENVREAYDWLVERYREGDEVYIFGFSRGAYTARSLVGMIANCGLLYRGAPLPPEQLWNGYRKMTPYPEPKRPDGTPVPTRKWWQPFGAQKRGPFRPLQHLKKDDFPGGSVYTTYIPEGDRSETEELLCRWSRRIPIHCLAVFDTVRTLGIEALAIPWLRDRKTQFHKTQLTWLIQNGFHALAIDEHRANFSHVPWHRKSRKATATNKDPATSGPIKQRWFIGAHSNIGGSYDDGALAQLPLAWFVKECSGLGLVFKPRRPDEPDVRVRTREEDCIPLFPGKDNATGNVKPGHVRDSYTELGGGIWRHLLRAKRYYRRIAPPAEFEEREEVKSLNEELDESVLKLIGLNSAAVGADNYNPPNLYEYRARPETPAAPALPVAPEPREPPHKYCETRAAKVGLGAWLLGIALSGEMISLIAVGWQWHWIHILPMLFFLAAWRVDWLESSLTHKRAVRPRDAAGEKLDGWLDLLMNLRLIAVAAFVVGIGFLLWAVWALIDRFTFYPVPLAEAVWLVAFCAMLMRFNSSRIWAARPMREAGFGSIVQLQNAKTPAGVVALREAWMRLCLRPSDAAKLDDKDLKDYHTADAHRLLPVHRAIWRDRIGFIPAYSVAFFAGLWVMLSLLQGWWLLPECSAPPIMGLLSPCWSCWGPAAFIVLVAALADYIEDSIHIGYLEEHANAPTAGTVWSGWILSKIKLWACLVGMAGLAAAILLLGCRQICYAFEQPGKCPLCSSTLKVIPGSSTTVPALVSILLAVLAIYLVFSAIMALAKREPEIHCR